MAKFMVLLLATGRGNEGGAKETATINSNTSNESPFI